jgi:RNA polymerase sigma-70 factor (ECF subfamily)
VSAPSTTTLAATLPAAFVEIVRAHTPRVWRFLRYQGVPEADLADGSQEVFLVVYRRLSEFRGDAQLTTWIYEICFHVGRARRRKRTARREDLGDVAEEIPAPSTSSANDARRVVTALLERLPEDQRAVVVLHEIEELPMPEVARIVGCRVFTAYSRLRLARQKMKQMLEEDGGR